MKKEEFMKELKEKLDILDEKEIKDIIEEYTGYIDEKVKSGKTEEEAIKDFGSIDELTTELLKAYKINVNKKEKEKNFINNFVESINNWIDKVIQCVSKKSNQEIIRMIIEILIILLIIGLCKIPFEFMEKYGYNIFQIFQNSLGRLLYRLWKFMLEILYLIFAVVVFIKIINRRYLDGITITKNKNSLKKTMKDVVVDKKPITEPRKRDVIDLLSSLCLLFLKFIVFWFILGVLFYILGLAFAFGICLLLMTKKVFYIGTYFVILSLLVLGVLFFIPMFNFMINRKNNTKALLIAFLTNFIILGISISASSIEIATIDWKNELPKDVVMSTETKTIKWNNTLWISGNVTFEEDENLPNDIEIVYTYPSEIYKIKPDVIRYKEKVMPTWEYSGYQNIIDYLIEDLKNHELHNYAIEPQITIKTTKENIAMLKLNAFPGNSSYQQCKKEVNTSGYENLSNYCKEYLEELWDD